MFSPDKLIWLNQHYIKTLPLQDVADYLSWHMQSEKIDVTQGPALTEIVDVFRERAKTLKEMAQGSRYFYEDVTSYEEKAAKHLKEAALEPLQRVLQSFEQLPEWTAESVHHAISAVAEMLDIKMGKIGQPVRVAVTGGTMSPPMGATLALIGKRPSSGSSGRLSLFRRKKPADGAIRAKFCEKMH